MPPSPHQPELQVTQGERSGKQRPLGVRVMIAKITSAPIHLLPVVKIARKGTLLGGLNEDTETFGPLKVILQAIPALFANRDVRLRSPTQWHSPLTGTFSGNRRRGEQDRKPAFTCGRSGRSFQFTSK